MKPIDGKQLSKSFAKSHSKDKTPAISNWGFAFLVGPAGLEPGTKGL